jgi:PBP1b-binding outer membrane lipoprotein LpoB
MMTENRHRPDGWYALFVLLVLLLAMIVFFFTNCYNQKKAQQQFAKAAINYPKIPADYCALNFPVRDSIIRGDTVTTLDTMYIDQIRTDTLMNELNDTVYIVTTLPAKIVTKIISRTDTVFKENTANLKSCQLDNSNLIQLLRNKTSELDNWKGKAQKRGWIMWGLIILIAAVIGLRVWRFINVAKLPNR